MKRDRDNPSKIKLPPHWLWLRNDGLNRIAKFGVHGSITVSIGVNIASGKWEDAEINWSAIGSVSRQRASDFAAAIMQAEKIGHKLEVEARKALSRGGEGGEGGSHGS